MTTRVILATGLGTGYAPVAPGTVGSLLGLALYALLFRIGGHAGAATGALAVTALGFWAADAGPSHFGVPDPGPVVIDEVAGQMLTLLFLPFGPGLLLAGFVIFRVLDIAKPFPARRLEALPGGSGIMADDLLVAVYGNLLLRALGWVFPWIFG